jgi:hypothetical protein
LTASDICQAAYGLLERGRPPQRPWSREMFTA